MHKDMLTVFESLPGFYLLLKPDAPHFTIAAISDDLLATTRTKRAEIVGRELFEVFPDNPDDPNATGKTNLTASLRKVMKTKKPHEMAVQKYDIPHPKGGFEERYWTPRNTPIFDDKGEIKYILNTSSDVTSSVELTKQRERHGEEIALLRQRHNTLFQQDFVAIAVLRGPDYVIEQANPLVCQIWDRTAKQVIDKPLFEALPETAGQGVEELLAGVYKAGEPYFGTELPVMLRRKGKLTKVYFDFNYIPMRDAENKVSGITVLAIDVTSRVRTNSTLQESERRFRKLADTAPMYLALADENGNATYFNKPWLEFTGKTMDEMKGLGWLSTVHPEDALKFEKDFKNAFQKQIPINEQYRFRRADGEYRWMLAVGAPRISSEGEFIGYYGTYTDFHDLKVAQLAVQESEERFRTVANNISQLVWESDPAGHVIWYNQRWHDYTGIKKTDALSVSWQKLIHPKHLKDITDSFMHSSAHGQIWENTFPLKGKTGRYRWFLSRAIPIKDEHGKIVKWFGTSTDIHDLRRATRRQAELELTTTALKEQRERLLALNQAKDEFISLASHQLRTPATGVKQYIGMLLEGYAGDIEETQRPFIQKAYDSNERQIMIVNDLLKVARIDSGKLKLQFEKVDLVRLVQEVIDEQSAKFDQDKQQVLFASTESAIQVTVDKLLFRMAIENIIDNAHKYTFPGKNIMVSVSCNDNSVQIAVADQGTGIAAEDMAKLFQKFSRIDNPLSAAVGGTGLGLYWVKRVVDMHDGMISVDSEVDKGTTFTISLPCGKPER